MLIDEVEIIIKGGHGGPGKVSFSKRRNGGPDGGNGGKGGDVYLLTTSDLTALNQYSREKLVVAENGEKGDSNQKSGRDGTDKVATVPIGSELVEKNTGEMVTLDQINQKVLICKGGIGGRGNFELKSSRRTTPEFAQTGRAGEEKHFQVNLKLLADYGLIGLPNAGKSSLLNELTSAKATVGDYPFTTLEPNLGVVNGKIIADIPGLIEGASTGKGLGIKFLKHIEKVNSLLHCVSADSDDVKRDYQVVIFELAQFSKSLSEKKQVILLTKSDLINEGELNTKVKALKTFKHQVIPISIHDWESIDGLRKLLLN